MENGKDDRAKKVAAVEAKLEALRKGKDKVIANLIAEMNREVKAAKDGGSAE